MKRRYLLPALLIMGALAVLGTRRANGGAFSHTLVLSGYPVALAVDGKTSHAFVIDAASYTIDVIDTRSGDLLGTAPIGTGATAIAVVERTGRVFVPDSGDGTVTMLSARSGLVLGTIALGFTPGLTAVNARTGRVYIVDASGAVLAILDGASGAILHRTRLPGVPVALAMNTATGQLLMATTDNAVRAFDAENGRLLRVTSLPGYPVAIAVDEATGHEFVLDPNDTALIVLDGKTSRIIRVTRVAKNPITVIGMSAIDRVLVASRAAIPGLTGQSAIGVIDAASGRMVRNISMDESPNDVLAGIGPDFFVDVGSAVLEIDARNGARLRSLPLRGARFTAQGLALDRRTQRLFVVSSDASNVANPPALLDWARRWLPFMPNRSVSTNGGIDEYGIAG